MSYVKRWVAGMFSRVDGYIARIENHEALVDEALRELRQATARARVRVQRVQADGERLRRSLAGQRDEVGRWRERARRSAEESRAIECLRRGRRAAAAAAELERRLEVHDGTQRKLAADVHRLEERLGRLQEQRNLMRTREARAEAMGALECGAVQLGADLDAVFDRWESRVVEAEYAGGVGLEGDDRFESEYAGEEEEAELRAELEALRREDHG